MQGAFPDSCFNSMKVRLKPLSAICKDGGVNRFNSMKVRLKRIRTSARCTRKRQFQFHEGPIKTSIMKYNHLEKLSFNSMKVRLKLAQERCISTLMTMFQFHEGPIKTCKPPLSLSTRLGFNSMKVRLKLGYEFIARDAYKFQFHEGPIKTVCADTCSVRRLVSIP